MRIRRILPFSIFILLLFSCGRHHQLAGDEAGGVAPLPPESSQKGEEKFDEDAKDKHNVTARDYAPSDLVEAMRKSLLKVGHLDSTAHLAEARFSVWLAPKGGDIGSHVSIGSGSSINRHLFCHYHGDLMACHSIQAPGLSGNPDPEEPVSPDLPPIDPF